MVALAVGDPEGTEGGELVRGLDAFGDDHGADLAGETDEGGGEGPPGRIGVDAPDQTDVELDDVGPEVEDVAEAGETGARVVDREPDPDSRSGARASASSS